jgi:hypothetical protein
MESAFFNAKQQRSKAAMRIISEVKNNYVVPHSCGFVQMHISLSIVKPA